MSCYVPYQGAPAVVGAFVGIAATAWIVRGRIATAPFLLAAAVPVLLWGLLWGSFLGGWVPTSPCYDTEPFVPQPEPRASTTLGWQTLMLLAGGLAGPAVWWMHAQRNAGQALYIGALPIVFGFMVWQDVDMGGFGLGIWISAVSVWLACIPTQILWLIERLAQAPSGQPPAS